MRKGLLVCILCVITNWSYSQLSLTNASPSALIDFSNLMPTSVSTNPSTAYTGGGFSANPLFAGRLNSNAWAVTGWSDGNLAYGNSQVTAGTDYTRGTTSVAVTTGGFYAYTGSPASVANPTFMIQPGGSDFAPGSLTLRLQNNSSTDAITQLTVSYNLYVRNDQGRGNSFNFSYSADNTTYTNIPALDYTSTAAADGFGWVLVGTAPSRTTVISGLNIAPGAYFYLRWSSDDVSGSGSRDEFGLDDINISATFTPASTDYYRTVASGNWSNIAVWETSSDNITWVPALLPPTASANTITIRNGHTVSITSSITADQLIIATGGVLAHPNGQTFTLNNGTGIDMTIEGNYELNGTQPSGSGTIEIVSGGLVKVNSNPSPNESDDFAFGNANVTFFTGSVYEWASVNTPSWSNRVYFTPGQITTFRFTATPGGILGGGTTNTTIVHGILQAEANITIHNSADKTFVNGITGAGNIYADASFTGNILITGSTAVLGGSGLLSLPVSPASLRIGTGTVVTMLTDKAIKGDITLLPNSRIELGNFNLLDTGTITGGTTNYIKTNGTGSLILGNVTGLRNAPIGNSTYNPLTITNTSGHNWSLRVEDVLGVSNPAYSPNIVGAVLREWHITPSVNPPATGADIVFQWDDSDPTQIGASYNSSENVLVWHEVPSAMPWLYDWISVGTAQTATGTPPGVRTASISNWSWFSPFAVSTISYPLPIKLVSFNAIKLSSSHAIINWQLAACCSKDARFELEKSTDGRTFTSIANIQGSETNVNYSFTDSRLAAGSNYYRLKAVDADGKITYSRIAAIINAAEGFAVTGVTPNPVTSSATISVSAAARANLSFSIVNAAGVVVRQWQQTVNAGTQQIPVDVSALPAGMYYLTVYGSGEKTVVRFLRQ